MDNQVPQVWQVNRDLPTPLFKQLADNIKWTIYSSSIKPGTKLPPVHQLAKSLGVSVSTVQSAYRLLEDLGLIITRPHHGTEIVSPGSRQESQDIDISSNVFLGSVNALLNSGYSEQAITHIFKQALDRATNKKKLLFIECDEYDKKTLVRQLSDFLDTTVDFMLVDELSPLTHSNFDFSQYKAIVTTYFHHATVKQRLSSTGLPIFTVVTEFNKNTLLNISKFEPHTKIAVVCQPHHSPDYLINMILAIRDDLDIKTAIITNQDNQRDILEWADVCFPNHPCEQTIKELFPDKPIYFFCDQINSQSIGILKENLNMLPQDQFSND